jgi:hypothetical protein
MFHMSLKYIYLLHVSTSLGHLQVTFFFQGIYRTAHIVSHTLKYAVIYSYFLCYMVLPLPIFCVAAALLYIAESKMLHYRRKGTTNNDSLNIFRREKCFE